MAETLLVFPFLFFNGACLVGDRLDQKRVNTGAVSAGDIGKDLIADGDRLLPLDA